ncbi:hypothetical protein [Streptomyces sp. NBC_00582]|uniref:hypothetical protein n=1 Tax=Streptomyces sp. NBC_00582 TaxID=2975783 RepID=UPI002E8011AF|nr:hypothetical protein [Streptomyces sp. NBC_00582]WUB61496.1 hypothetical protein OG852_14405 [Streptomyces sp. NBC_00582]
MLKRSVAITVADLESSRIAAFTAVIDGTPVAVVNARAREDPEIREQAAAVLADLGVDERTIREVVNGVRR